MLKNQRQISFVKFTKQPNLPLFVFLPPLDGTGQSLHPQIPKLASSFEISSLLIPLNDRSNWEKLTTETVNFIKQEKTLNPDRPIFLCGESFGGCLALQVATQSPDLINQLTLVNSASALRQLPWLSWFPNLVEVLPEPAYYLSSYGLLPYLAQVDRIAKKDVKILLSVIQTIPQATSAWRLNLLRSFQVDESSLKQLKLPVLILASGADRLLPSLTEGEHLSKTIPNCQLVKLPHSGHACLLEQDINLDRLILNYSNSRTYEVQFDPPNPPLKKGAFPVP